MNHSGRVTNQRLPYQPPMVNAEINDPGTALALWHALAPAPPPPAEARHNGRDTTTKNEAYVRACMIAAPDGSVTIDGRSGGLGTPMDYTVYRTLRMRADLILASMSTIRTEGYGPASVEPLLAHLRHSGPPPIWALTRTLRAEDIDYLAERSAQSEADSGDFELVVSAAGAAPKERAYALERGVSVREIPGEKTAFLAGAIAAAKREAPREVLVETGPRLLAALLAENLCTELALTIAPSLQAPPGTALIPDDESAQTWQRKLRVISAFTSADGGLYTRWLIQAADEDQRESLHRG